MKNNDMRTYINIVFIILSSQTDYYDYLCKKKNIKTKIYLHIQFHIFAILLCYVERYYLFIISFIQM